jgi:hypothetical protein
MKRVIYIVFFIIRNISFLKQTNTSILKANLHDMFYDFQQSIAPDLLYEVKTDKRLILRCSSNWTIIRDFFVGVFWSPTHSTYPLLKITILLRSMGDPLSR